ncbi:MAG TPA: hypothetical protein VI669_19650, partial [Vicinamibacteria bacterium]
MIALFSASILVLVAAGSPPRHFEVAAAFVPSREAGRPATVSVVFSPTDPDVQMNEEPAPR